MALNSDGWTGNVTGAWDGNNTLMPSNYSSYNATFVTGYPYIGMPGQVFDNLAKMLEAQDDDIECDDGYCQAEKNCTDMKPLQDISFEMAGYIFSMPMNSTFY